MWIAAGYYDESDDVDRGYAVAGFFGHQHDCVHFDFAWKERLLDKYELEYFKASELNAGSGQFAKFRDYPHNLNSKFSERERKLFGQIKIDSIDIILSFPLLTGIGAVLMLPDYHRIAKEYKVAGKIIPAPYWFCMQLVMMESGLATHRINRGSSSSQQGLFRPVFDSHEDYSGRAKEMFDDFSKSNPIASKTLLPPHYESDKDYLMLQAADNLAYECRRLLITQEFEKHIPERIAMTRLKELIYKVYKLNYQGLKVILESQSPNKIPFEADIHNRNELLDKWSSLEEEAVMSKQKSEFEKFSALAKNVINVPHSAIKAQLDAEKKAK